jgi:hypothetical protein
MPLNRSTLSVSLTGGSLHPEDIAGLELWLDADSIDTLWQDSGSTKVTADGDPIGRWQSKVITTTLGSKNNFDQTTTSRKPTYKINIQGGRPVIRFDGGDNLDGTEWMSDASDLSFFCVASTTGAADDDYIYSDRGTDANSEFFLLQKSNGATPTNALRFGSRDSAGNWVGSGGIISSGLVFDQVYLVYFRYDAATYAYGVDSTESFGSTGTWTSADFSNYTVPRIGAMSWTDANQHFLTGDISEILIWNRKLSEKESSDIRNYLANKWSIAI